MEMTIDRLKHSLAVAVKMKQLAEDHYEGYQIDPEEAYVLGLVHDIGYQFVDDQRDHSYKGGELLKSQGYKYWKEVYYHGLVQDDYDSEMLRLLNYVDMTTDNKGEYVSMQDRLKGITERYGKDSWQATEAVKLACIINEY